MTPERMWNGSRFTKRGRARWVALSLLLTVGTIVGLAVATDTGGSGTSASGLCNDKLTQSERSGTTQAMLAQHQHMMDQMRASLSPQMQSIMDADPMWKSMRTGEFAQEMQDQQQQIDRMLGVAPTCATP